MNLIRFFTAVVCAFLLAACGGGGGSPGAQSGAGNPGTPGVTPGTPTTGVATVAVGILDAGNAVVRNIQVGGAFSAAATVRDARGTPVVGTVVNFSIDGKALATLAPETALTDASGTARVAINPTSTSAVGAASVVATANVGGETVSGRSDFEVTSSSLALSAIDLGSASLPSGGNTPVSVTALLSGQPSSGVPVNVSFSASCGRINGSASSVSVTTSGSGVASAVYTAVAGDGSLCSGSVNLTASTAGATPRTTLVTVAAPAANAVTFVSAAPSQIFLKGSGAAEQSLVKFRVLAGATPLSNIPVVFSLEVNPGGVGLGASGSATSIERTTDAQGVASIDLFSATLPGPVRVRAALKSDPTIFAESQNLSVSSGPPSQKFMSLSVETFNIEGWNVDGVGTKLTVRLADRQGNAVEDGTVVNFTAEGGQVASSCATTRSANISSCSVDFISQNPRPAGGRVSVLAFTNGTKDYTDVNPNNSFDPGIDTLFNQGDAYRDDDEDGQFDPGEFIVQRGGADSCPAMGSPFPGRDDTCDSSLATTVRQQAVILFASSNPALTALTAAPSAVSFRLATAQNVLLPMPAGTLVSAEAVGGTCAIDKTLPTTVPNVDPGIDPAANLTTQHFVYLKDCVPGNTVLVSITSPRGLKTTIPVNIP